MLVVGGLYFVRIISQIDCQRIKTAGRSILRKTLECGSAMRHLKYSHFWM